MKKTGIVFALIGACLMLAPNLAQAQATRTWISGVGDDVNPCSRTAPCKTFAGAISKTAAGGEIDTLDPGGFGAVTVTKAMTLADEGAGEAGILVAGTNGITVNCATDPNCSVVIRGLVIDGGPVGSNSLNGIRFVAGRSLTIENCAIRNFTGGAPNGYGVSFQPSASQTHYLTIAHTTINQSGAIGSNNGAGVLVQPSGSAVVNASIVNDVITQNNIGVRADGSNLTGGGITVNVSDSAVTNNANAGVASVSTNTNPVTVIVSNSQVTGNGVGLNANGTNKTVLRVGYSTVSFNSGGGYKQQNAAIISSYGNNIFSDNGADTGTLSTSPGLQ
ncbi:MAG: hypothetical protein JOZ72_03345 [Alphaproteobacteria bacterium]|nr:hypothetical protein [Alphaproteobacteria bacterium]